MTAAVRHLTSPSVSEVDALAVVFDHYRVHYGETADVQRSASWLRENLEAGGLHAFVAEDRGRLVGFATTMRLPASLGLSHFWQVRDLFVLPDQRRLGIGAALIAAVRAAATESGAQRLALQTEDANDPALALYRRLGFVPVAGYQSLTLPLSRPTRGEAPRSGAAVPSDPVG